MKRRKFIQASAVSAITPFAFESGSLKNEQDTEKALFEHRVYDIRFGGNQQLLLDYLADAYKPALSRKGISHFMLFREYGLTEPSKLHVIISYPNLASYIAAQNLTGDSAFMSQASAYRDLSPDQYIYTRFSSSLLLAFDGLPAIKDPVENAGIFELRTYEGYSENAVHRKIKMFNVEEIDLFYKTGLHPVFFGEMIAGPYRPCLVYMLGFRDMEERDANWQTFIDHPEWKAMVAKPEYANSVNNIRRTFLTPVNL